MNVDIAERLAKRRREAGYSQENLAEKLGVSRQAVSKWERSESSPDTDNLIALAQLYGVSLDELLYVDESFQEDVEFEAADRAAERKAEGVGAKGASTPPFPYGVEAGVASSAEPTASGATGKKAEDSSEKEQKVNIGPGGIHMKDGEDYVHLTWRDGIHVKDGNKGDEVHVGWSGIHVKEGKRKNARSGDCGEGGNEVHWDAGKVVVNGEEYDSWQDAKEYFSEKHGMGKNWLRFPFPLLVIIAYIMTGVFVGAWGIGLFLFFLIPLYYMFGHLIQTKKIAHFFEGLYPILAVAGFLYMAFIMNQPHPAWVIFLTIPLVEWFIHSLSRSYRRRKKEAEVIDI